MVGLNYFLRLRLHQLQQTTPTIDGNERKTVEEDWGVEKPKESVSTLCRHETSTNGRVLAGRQTRITGRERSEDEQRRYGDEEDRGMREGEEEREKEK